MYTLLYVHNHYNNHFLIFLTIIVTNVYTFTQEYSMVHWIPMRHLFKYDDHDHEGHDHESKQPRRLHVFNFFKESYRCIDIRPEGIDEDIFESEVIASHSADLLAVRPEYGYGHGDELAPPIYIGSNFHYSCGLELKSMQTYVDNAHGYRRVALEFEKGYMNKFDSVDPAPIRVSNKTTQAHIKPRAFPNWIWIYLPYTKKDGAGVDTTITREELKLKVSDLGVSSSGAEKVTIEVDGTSIVILQHGERHEDHGHGAVHTTNTTDMQTAYVVAGGHHMRGVILKIALISINLTEGQPDLEICW